jgi:hypothetical protein
VEDAQNSRVIREGKDSFIERDFVTWEKDQIVYHDIPDDIVKEEVYYTVGLHHTIQHKYSVTTLFLIIIPIQYIPKQLIFLLQLVLSLPQEQLCLAIANPYMDFNSH